jgi:hypothetical protein
VAGPGIPKRTLRAAAGGTGLMGVWFAERSTDIGEVRRRDRRHCVSRFAEEGMK